MKERYMPNPSNQADDEEIVIIDGVDGIERQKSGRKAAPCVED